MFEIEPKIKYNKLFVVVYGNRHGYAVVLIAFDDEGGGVRVLDIQESKRPNNFEILEILNGYFGKARTDLIIQLRDETGCLIKSTPSEIFINPECGVFSLAKNRLVTPKKVIIDETAGWDLSEGINSNRVTFAGGLGERGIDCLEDIDDENDLLVHHLASALLLACSTKTIPLRVWGLAGMVE